MGGATHRGAEGVAARRGRSGAGAGRGAGCPSPASFGIENFGTRTIKVALAPSLERQADVPLTPLTSWPLTAIPSLSPDTAVLPVPGVHNFRYARLNPAATLSRPKVAAKKPALLAKPRETHPPLGLVPLLWGNRPRPVGHQLTVPRPPTGVSAHAR